MLKQFYQDNDEVTSMVHEAFIVGSTLYTMAIQFLVANAVFHDPQQYARMVPMTALGAKQFKENPSVKGMKKFLTTNMVTSATGPTAGQKILLLSSHNSRMTQIQIMTYLPPQSHCRKRLQPVLPVQVI